jgi:hypothetical protein
MAGRKSHASNPLLRDFMLLGQKLGKLGLFPIMGMLCLSNLLY